jgi:hypothetical protein
LVALQPNGSLQYPTPHSRASAAALVLRETGPAPAPKPRLPDRVREAIRTRRYSRRTEDVRRVDPPLHPLPRRHPVEMGAPEITRFLTALAVEWKVAASTQNHALSALLFLYREVLQQHVPWLDDLVYAKRPHHLPVVLPTHVLNRGAAEVRSPADRLFPV